MDGLYVPCLDLILRFLVPRSLCLPEYFFPIIEALLKDLGSCLSYKPFNNKFLNIYNYIYIDYPRFSDG